MPGQISEITNGNPVCNAANSDTGRLVTNARCDRIAVESGWAATRFDADSDWKKRV